MKNSILLIALLATVCFSSCEKNEPQIIEKIVEKEVPAPVIDDRDKIVGEYNVIMVENSKLYNIATGTTTTNNKSEVFTGKISKSSSSIKDVTIEILKNSKTELFSTGCFMKNILTIDAVRHVLEDGTIYYRIFENTTISSGNSFVANCKQDFFDSVQKYHIYYEKSYSFSKK